MWKHPYPPMDFPIICLMTDIIKLVLKTIYNKDMRIYLNLSYICVITYDQASHLELSPLDNWIRGNNFKRITNTPLYVVFLTF